MYKRITIILLSLLGLISCSDNPVDEFQSDADLIRLEHLVYWTSLLDEYQTIKGHYPFQDQLENDEGIVLVKIATRQQLKYLSAGSSEYNPKLDNNHSDFFEEHAIKDFVIELENVLEKPIEEKYDIQKIPTSSPVGYYYFVSKDGYLVWATCITCGVTEISTLLMDGFTPTVNIVSKDMIGLVPKALVRGDMLDHQLYKNWVIKPFHKEVYIRELVTKNHRDSKL
jgi:hypothetical protein